VNCTGGGGSTVEEEGDRGEGSVGILPMSTCDGATGDNHENRPLWIRYNKKEHALLPSLSGVVIRHCMPMDLHGGSCDDSTQLDSARLGSVRDVCTSKGCATHGTMDMHRRVMCG
jgi:hypothetical protein